MCGGGCVGSGGKDGELKLFLGDFVISGSLRGFFFGVEVDVELVVGVVVGEENCFNWNGDFGIGVGVDVECG